MAGEHFDELAQLFEEEALFARDIDGQLVRAVKATRADYDREITMSIDGQQVTVKKAVPTTDAQGNIIEDADGNSIPRDTTIYDAAQQLFVRQQGKQNPIPILCHQEHMRPVAVCRMCSVEVCRVGRDGSVSPGGKLAPACHHPVKDKMVVHTIYSPDTKFREHVRTSVKLLTELLASDHLYPAGMDPESLSALSNVPTEFERHMLRLENDLEIECDPTRLQFRDSPDLGIDNSSSFIAVNHSACILCERCKRGCSEIKENFVIGRTGKGYHAHIAFDLNNPMQDSSCVSCGECMVYCPTDALTFRRPVESDWHKQAVAQDSNAAVTASELRSPSFIHHRLFEGLPFKWLQWNASSIVRRRVKAGELLCRQGEYGSTAFILTAGRFGVWFRDPAAANQQAKSGGLLSRLFGKNNKPVDDRKAPTAEHDVTVDPENVILGEMTCMSFYPRNATVAALEDGEYLEIRRNVLFALQRNAHARAVLDQVYRDRALSDHLRTVKLFQNLSREERTGVAEFLKDKVELVRVDPGQAIFHQGDKVDHFYMIRIGYVKVSIDDKGRERVLTYLKPKDYFGEIGVMTVTDRDKLEVAKAIQGKRTATCTALDDVELVRIRGRDFVDLLLKFKTLHQRFVELGRARLDESKQLRDTIGGPLKNFLDQGLFNAQKLLVLDLEACTRCDECVKACADTHGGVTRLVREGMRFENFLVASACRSCEDPYCLVGCPVDSIHRDHSLEIAIEDHCIGCGQCASNCPYGNINMHGVNEVQEDPQNPGRTRAVVQQRATTCDLCNSVGIDAGDPKQKVSCVYACPHNAAFRMSGTELFDQIRAQHAAR